MKLLKSIVKLVSIAAFCTLAFTAKADGNYAYPATTDTIITNLVLVKSATTNISRSSAFQLQAVTGGTSTLAIQVDIIPTFVATNVAANDMQALASSNVITGLAWSIDNSTFITNPAGYGPITNTFNSTNQVRSVQFINAQSWRWVKPVSVDNRLLTNGSYSLHFGQHR